MSQKWIVSFMLEDFGTLNSNGETRYRSKEILLLSITPLQNMGVDQIAIIQLTSKRRGGKRKKKEVTQPVSEIVEGDINSYARILSHGEVKGESKHEEVSSGDPS